MPPALSEREQADYEERAAILEFDAGLSRPEAERRARQMVMAARRLPAISKQP